MLVKLILETEDRFHHEVISLTEMDQQGVILKNHRIPVHTLDMSVKIFAPFFMIRLSRMVKKINPSLVHGWMYHGNVAASMASGFLLSNNIPLFHSIRHSLHDTSHEKWSTAMVIRLNSRVSKSPDKLIYNSYISKKQHTKFGYESDTAIVIPNGFETDIYIKNDELRRDSRERMKIPSNSFTFLQIGRNHPMKNHEMFLEAAYHLLQQSSFRSKPFFVLIGNGIPEDRKLQEWVEIIGDSGVVKLVDEQADLVPYYCSADAFTLSSSWGEAFPNVLGEAMSCGLPCITTDVGDAARIVQDTGIVIQPGDVTALTNAMKTMMDWSDEERTRRGEMARQLITEHYSIEKVAEMYCSLYSEHIG